jgi:signal transduction histidine kinase
VGAILLVVAGGVLLWITSRAFAPVFSLAATIDRFAKGDWGARAQERGATELRAMSRQFNEMAEALAAQRRLQMAFLGGVAHELRNRLGVLTLSVALVDPEKPLPPERALPELFGKISRQIDLIARRLSDLTDTALIEAGALELRAELVDARMISRHVADLFDGTSGSRLDIVLPDEVVPLHCDRARLEQVLTNLISNAVKYSPPASPIELALEPRDGEAVFRVTDHGVGITAEDRQRLFEPFRRFEATKNAAPGMGLGLFVVRRIVEAHGGSLRVDSAPGKGSTFCVHLPAPQPPPRSVVPAHAGPRGTQAGRLAT